MDQSGYDSDDLQFVDDLNLDAELPSHDDPESRPQGQVEADSTTDIRQSAEDNAQGDGDLPIPDDMEIEHSDRPNVNLETDGPSSEHSSGTLTNSEQSESMQLFTVSETTNNLHPDQSTPSATEPSAAQRSPPESSKPDFPSQSMMFTPDVLPSRTNQSTPDVLPSRTDQSIPVDNQSAVTWVRDELNEIRTPKFQPEREVKVPSDRTIIKHFIDGFIIEESAVAFPVHRSSLLTELIPRSKITRKRVNPRCYLKSGISNQGRSRNNTPTSTRVNTPEPTDKTGTEINAVGGGNKYICVRCSKVCGALLKFYQSQPYCSKKCIIQFKRRMMDELGIKPKRGRPAKNRPSLPNLNRETSHSTLLQSPRHSYTELSSPTQSYTNISSYYVPIIKPGTGHYVKPGAGVLYKKNDVLHWTVDDVKSFVQSLDGCARYCGEFVEQEIDGRALLLLNQDILLNALEMQLKPAMTIYSHITTLLT